MLRRLALIAFGLTAGVIALEVVLQLGAVAVRLMGRQAQASWLTGRTRVLAVGDSNTYGYLVEPQEAYPKAFEQQWNAAHPDRPIEVLNVGYPGTNSSRVIAMLPRLLQLLRPEIVTIMIGANDFWTKPVVATSPAWTARADLWLYRWVRVYRLAHMLRRALEQPQLEVSNAQPPVSESERAELRGEHWQEALGRMAHEKGFEGELFRGAGQIRIGAETVDVAWAKSDGGAVEWQKGLATNLATAVQLIRAGGATPVLLTYPSGQGAYGAVDVELRQLADALGVRLIDLTTALAPRCPEWRCAELLPDQHPSVAGHAWAAGELVRRGLAPPISP